MQSRVHDHVLLDDVLLDDVLFNDVDDVGLRAFRLRWVTPAAAHVDAPQTAVIVAVADLGSAGTVDGIGVGPSGGDRRGGAFFSGQNLAGQPDERRLAELRLPQL